jgi:hypothetical protein
MMTPSALIAEGGYMKAEIEDLASEVQRIREKCRRPKYPPELVARALGLMEKNDVGELAMRIGVGKDTLQRWQKQSAKMLKPKAAAGQLTFSPVLPEKLPEKSTDKIADAEQLIRLDFSYRDGRRMVLELPATKASCQDLLGSLRQEFFRGC